MALHIHILRDEDYFNVVSSSFDRKCRLLPLFARKVEDTTVEFVRWKNVPPSKIFMFIREKKQTKREEKCEKKKEKNRKEKRGRERHHIGKAARERGRKKNSEKNSAENDERGG